MKSEILRTIEVFRPNEIAYNSLHTWAAFTVRFPLTVTP